MKSYFNATWFLLLAVLYAPWLIGWGSSEKVRQCRQLGSHRFSGVTVSECLPVMENQMIKKQKHEMETRITAIVEWGGSSYIISWF